jgi:hypothetical protein
MYQNNTIGKHTMRKKPVQQQFNFDIVKKLENYSSTVDELRSGMFAPIAKIPHNSLIYKNFVANKNVRTIENSWGKVELRNRILTQIHRDIIDAILSVSKEMNKINSGIEVYFSTTDVLKKLKQKNLKNHKWLREKIKEIADFRVVLSKNGEDRSFNIFVEDDASEEKGLNRVVFTNRYLKFFDESLLINYKNELDKLLEVDSALLKAIIRFFWTHSTPKFSISIEGSDEKKGLLETIGFPMDSIRIVQRAKKEIRDNKEYLAEYGIIYEEDKKNKLTYLKSSFDNKISFYNSLKDKSILLDNSIDDDIEELVDKYSNIILKDSDNSLSFELSDIKVENSRYSIVTKDGVSINLENIDSIDSLKEYLENISQ